MDHLPGFTASLPATIALLALSYIAYQRFLSPLHALPGPFFASLSTLWLAYAYHRGDWHVYSRKIHARYGPIVRIGPSVVSVADPSAIKTIYGVGTKFFKGQWYQHLLADNPGQKNLLGVTDKVEHKRMRRVVDPMYTLKALRESETLFEDPISAFVAEMRGRKGQTVNMADWTIVAAVDAFASLTYGRRYGLLEKGGSDEGMLAFTENNWRWYTPLITLSSWAGYLEKRRKRWLLRLMFWRKDAKRLPIFAVSFPVSPCGRNPPSKRFC
jgi:cytochrome P450